jgi:hypothetical protein
VEVVFVNKFLLSRFKRDRERERECVCNVTSSYILLNYQTFITSATGLTVKSVN